MLELGLPRALVISALALTTTFAAGTAQAQEPAPPVAPAAPPASSYGYAPPSYGYGAPPVYPSPVTPLLDVEYPPEMRQRSTGMVAGGVVLMAFSFVGAIAGSAMVAAHEPTQEIRNDNCFDCGFEDESFTAPVVLKPGFQTAGIVTLVGSAVAMGTGITLLVIGSKKVPYDDGAAKAAKAARVTPSLRVGPTGATFSVQF
jgi:hypothetical protein